MAGHRHERIVFILFFFAFYKSSSFRAKSNERDEKVMWMHRLISPEYDFRLCPSKTNRIIWSSQFTNYTAQASAITKIERIVN